MGERYEKLPSVRSDTSSCAKPTGDHSDPATVWELLSPRSIRLNQTRTHLRRPRRIVTAMTRTPRSAIETVVNQPLMTAVNHIPYCVRTPISQVQQSGHYLRTHLRGLVRIYIWSRLYACLVAIVYLGLDSFLAVITIYRNARTALLLLTGSVSWPHSGPFQESLARPSAGQLLTRATSRDNIPSSQLLIRKVEILRYICWKKVEEGKDSKAL